MIGAWVCAVVFGAVAGQADTPEPLPPNEATGYFAARAEYSRARIGGLLPTDDLPELSALYELNGQVRHHYARRGFIYGDLSLIAQSYGRFRALGPDGIERFLPAHEVASYQPRISVNELFLFQEVRPELTILLGKKRVLWGPGFAFNPTDLLNPPKDPTDPSFQRAGSYLGMIEVPLETATFTFLAAPQVTRSVNGLPTRFFTTPSYVPGADTHSHYLLAARAYALVANADLNLMLFYTQRYNDLFDDKLRVGASFSRYFFTDYELHFEALFQQGNARDQFQSACLTSREEALACLAARQPLTNKDLLNDERVVPRILIGARTQLPDETMFSLEYLYLGDGYSRAQMQDLVSTMTLARYARESGLPLNGGLPGAPAAGDSSGLPVKFSFEPLSRHYLFFTVQKPKIRDDFTASLTLVANLQDLSGLVAPNIQWSAQEWLNLGLSAFVPFGGPKAMGYLIPDGSEARSSEYGLAPMDFRILFELRLFY